jgi:uncharacterized protein YchJ
VLAPPTPEALVRARYCAFVKRDAKFLRATSHPDNPALAGSSTTLPDGSVKQCSYEEVRVWGCGLCVRARVCGTGCV